MNIYFKLFFVICIKNVLSQRIADVTIVSSSGSNVIGEVTIREVSDKVHIEGKIFGLSPGKHGFHIHANSDIGNECRNAGAHFNPYEKKHGGPKSLDRHVGDLGNIEASRDGTAQVSITDSIASLNHLSNAYIGNLSIVVHAGIDDLGLGISPESLHTGNAGARVGCGKIVMRNSYRRFASQEIENIRAVVEIVPGSQDVTGQLQIRPRNGGIHIIGIIYGLSPGFHGFHIHQEGKLSNGCVDAGGHFNPYDRNHGSPERSQRHVGDLGNIFADGAKIAHINLFDDHASLDPLSPAYIGDRTIVVHASRDDLGLGQNAGSLKTGNAGKRSGCGKIFVTIDPQVNIPRSGQEVPKKDSIVLMTRAFANIVPSVNSVVKGDIILDENIDGIYITGTIEGLSPGLHGFHIHETGSLDNNCIGAGDHFNPFKRNHGSPRSRIRHVGDLGNIYAEANGIAFIQIQDNHISLNPNSISYVGNRAIVIHSGADDLGRGRNEGSLKTGNAGSRLACGIITVGEIVPREKNDVMERSSTVDDRLILFPMKRPIHSINSDLFNAAEKIKETAISTIVPGSSPTVRGGLEMAEEFGGIRIKGRIEGLTPGLHGFHVHQVGSLDNRCVSAGGHFNPFDKTHGDPDTLERHVGDLGNIFADTNGVANVNIYDDHISLQNNNPAYIGNRAFVVHAKHDDLGRGRNTESLKTGNAGSRVGCGIIVKSTFDELAHQESQQQNFQAMAVFVAGNNIKIRGELTLTQEPGGVFVKGQIVGLNPGLHGFHIHHSGDLGNKCSNAGGHFNPFQKNHGSPSAIDRHVGDLGNIKADSTGTAEINLFDNHISLNPKSDAFIGDRSFVVHALPDDLGLSANTDSLKTGNAGSRDGCAIIIPMQTEQIIKTKAVVHEFSTNQFVESKKESAQEKKQRQIFIPQQIIQPAQNIHSVQSEARYATGFQQQTIGEVINHRPELPQQFSSVQLQQHTHENLNNQDLIGVVDILSGRNQIISGSLTLTPSDDYSLVKITGFVQGLSPGYHGFHVHETGQLGNQCSDAGGHFNPFKKHHGAPRSKVRHVGDLGNIFADNDGMAVVEIIDDHISLDPNSMTFVGGRSFVIHADPDDLGFGNTDASRRTGNAGARSGCGTIILIPRQRLPQSHQKTIVH